jgi:hypothetical protein
MYLQTTYRFGEPKILRLCVFAIPGKWRVDPALKRMSRNALSLSVDLSMSKVYYFLHSWLSGSSACTICILYACVFRWQWRIFCVVVWGIWSCLLPRQMDFLEMCQKASHTILTVSSAAGLLEHFLFMTLPVSLNSSDQCLMDSFSFLFCMFHIVESLHLNRVFQLPFPQYAHSFPLQLSDLLTVKHCGPYEKNKDLLILPAVRAMLQSMNSK